MFHIRRRFLFFTFMCLPAISGFSQVNTQRGATVGGLTGAIAGGLIGDHNGEAGAGAAIGGLIGAVTGGLLGNAADKETQFRQHQALQQRQRQQLVDYQTAVSSQDVISMTRSGLSETVIINQIQQRGVQKKLQVADIIALHEQGVSESVITIMQQASVGPPIERAANRYHIVQPIPAITTPQVAAPIIVEEHYIIPQPTPRFYYHRGRGYHHHHYRAGIHIGF